MALSQDTLNRLNSFKQSDKYNNLSDVTKGRLDNFLNQSQPSSGAGGGYEQPSKRLTQLGLAGSYGKGFYEGVRPALNLLTAASPEAAAMAAAGVSPLKYAQAIEKPIGNIVSQIPEPQGTTERIAKAVGSFIPFSQQVKPISSIAGGLLPKAPGIIKSAATGLGYGGVSAATTEQPNRILPEALKTSGQFAAWYLGGKIPTKLGSIAGGATVGALTNPEDRVAGAVFGAGMNAMNRPEPFKGKQPIQYAKEATNQYRGMLKPTQGEIKNIEVRKGKNIDDYYKLAAEEQLPIEQSADNKLDTTKAREVLQPKQQQIHDLLNKNLKSNPNQQFDLNKIGEQAKLELKETIKNAKEYNDAASDIDTYIDAEITKYGRRTVTGEELNNVKQGMWSVGYNLMKPTAQSNARKIGFIAKEAIENAYSESNIKNLNELSGKYATLNNLLENSHGRVVKGGQISRYAAQGAGLIAGSLIPLPFIGRAAGALAGRYVGGKISEHLASPERISTVAGKKAQKAGMVGQSFKEVMSKKQPIPTNTVKPEGLIPTQTVSSPITMPIKPTEQPLEQKITTKPIQAVVKPKVKKPKIGLTETKDIDDMEIMRRQHREELQNPKETLKDRVIRKEKEIDKLKKFNEKAEDIDEVNDSKFEIEKLEKEIEEDKATFKMMQDKYAETHKSNIKIGDTVTDYQGKQQVVESFGKDNLKDVVYFKGGGGSLIQNLIEIPQEQAIKQYSESAKQKIETFNNESKPIAYGEEKKLSQEVSNQVKVSPGDGFDKHQKEYFVNELLKMRDDLLKTAPEAPPIKGEIPYLTNSEAVILVKDSNHKDFIAKQSKFIQLGLVDASTKELTDIGKTASIVNRIDLTGVIEKDGKTYIKIPNDGEFRIKNNLSSINEILKRLGVKSLEPTPPKSKGKLQ